MPDLGVREWIMLGPIAAAVLWMGIYPESFLAPMRNDIAALDARLLRAKPAGDADLYAGTPRGEAANAMPEVAHGGSDHDGEGAH